MLNKNIGDYDWLDDPFNDKKIARDKEQARLSRNTKTALGCGCLLVVMGVITLAILAGMGLLQLLS